MIRLDKYLADSGFGTRSQVKRIIRDGRVRVDGKVIKDPSFKLSGRERVLVDWQEAERIESYYIMLHKPAGYVTSTKDAAMTVMELVSDLPRFERLFPVGRLDKDAEGLLLLTDDGELAHRLTHPKWKVPKTYFVTVEGKVSRERLSPLKEGIELKDFKAKPAEFEILSVEGALSHIKITVREGKYHQVKRMLASLGHPVVYLKRIAFGPLELGGLLKGDYRFLTDSEIKALKKSVGIL